VHYHRSREGAEGVARNIEAAGGRAILLAGDLREEQQCVDVVERFAEAARGVDALVNNTGGIVFRGPATDYSVADWNETFALNCTSAFVCARTAIPHLRKSEHAALVMLSEAADQRLHETTSTSIACDLRKWRDIMIAYENGGHAYHATMPTDALRGFRDTMLETMKEGLTAVKERQWKLGTAVRELMAKHGFASVAAPGFEAPGVVVSYTDNDTIKSGAAFVQLGLQTAGGVPLMCDEPADFKTFRVGLFGLDKLGDVDAAVARLEAALNQLTVNS